MKSVPDVGPASASPQYAGRALISEVATQFGLRLEWSLIPEILRGPAIGGSLYRQDQEVRFVISAEGMISVEGSPKTPLAMGGETIENRETLLTTLTYVLAMKGAVLPEEYATQTQALYEAGQVEQAYAHFMADPRRSISDYYRLEDFIRHRQGAGSPAEATRLLPRGEREALVEAGATAAEIEQIARAGGSGKLIPGQEDQQPADPLAKRLLKARAERFAESFKNAGWEAGWVTVGDAAIPVMMWGDADGNHIQVELSEGLSAAIVKTKSAGETELRTVSLNDLPFAGRAADDDWPLRLVREAEGLGSNILIGRQAEAAAPEEGAAVPTDEPAPSVEQAQPVEPQGQGGSAPVPAPAPAYIESEEDAQIAEERVWRGLTAKELNAAYNHGGGRAVTVASKAITALSKAEAGDQLSGSDRLALAGFMGWGGVAADLRTDNRKSSDNYHGNQVASNLDMRSENFNRHLIENRLESYYTPAPLTSAIWTSLERLGVKPSSRVLEPGCGAGYFFAGAPADFQAQARFVGVECDEVALRMANAVAPDATYVSQRFERAMLDKEFDAVIGNVPFGDTRVSDRRYPDATHVHDYFIIRSLDHLKTGGIMAVITSSGTMDKAEPGVREQIMQRANLVAAFRLPADVFGEQNANVTTDVLILQRRPEGTAPDFDFTKSVTHKLEFKDQEHDFSINQYFLENPDNVLGNLTATSGPFGPKLQVTPTTPLVYGENARDQVRRIASQLEARMAAVLPEGLRDRSDWPQDQKANAPQRESATDLDPGSAMYVDEYAGFIGDYAILDGQVVEIIDVVNQYDDDGIYAGERFLAQPADVSPRHLPMLRAYIELREAARALMKVQTEGSDNELDEAQVAAQAAYDAFVEKYGPVNSPKNLKVYGDDCGSADVCALEVWDDDKEEVKRLADAFTQRVIHASSPVEIKDAVDAFYVCIDQRGRVDFAYMAEISGIAEEQLRQDLIGTKVFLDPADRQYKTDIEYLSGNVVLKLDQAREAVLTDESLSINVEALIRAQPAPVPFEDITINLGAGWIPTEDIQDFTRHLFQRNQLNEADFTVVHSAKVGLWTVDVSAAFKRDNDANRNNVWGTAHASYESLLEKLLNSQRPTHTYKDPETGKTHTDEEATMRSREKQEQIAEKFYQWVAMDPDRVARYTELYNKSTNVIVVPKPDGSRLTFPGLAASWKPRWHQSDMVAMGMMGYNAMAAHPVGAGKTFEMVALAMKLKQLGMVTKPMIAVPNHMLGQIAREAKQMYPGARVLMVTAEDLKGEKRKRFLGVARNNNWDIVVCTHSLLNQIKPPTEIVEWEFDRQIALINQQIEMVDNKRVERQLTAKLKTVQSQRDAFLEEIADEKKRDARLTLDQLGVDCLNVDEIHLYKNLELNSSMNVLGVTTAGSQRASNLWGLGEYLRQHWGRSFGMFGFTGTPIANTMCELYVHNYLLRPDLLEEIGIHHFDEWANRFGSVVSNLEALPEGGGFRVNERFAKFVNLPEMLRLFRSFADVKTKAELDLPTPEVETKVVSVPMTDWQKDFMSHLTIRAMQVRQGEVEPSEDNMLSVSTSGRKASLDLRLVDAVIPDDASLKLMEVARNVAQEHREHSDVKGTQLVFMDLGTPGKDKPFVAYEALRDEMVALGIPKHEVAFIHDAKTNDAKEALFAKVRSGEVRVLIGSTEKMGVGTNVQERLCALHHVDCPWRPADIEQRKGRIERQGNLYFKNVREYRYTVQDSFDLFMWETNKRKGDFINQALSDPNSAGREASEEMDLGYAEVLAVTTGDPLIREKVEVDDKVNKLERKWRAWTGERASRMMWLRHTEHEIEDQQRQLEIEKQVQQALPMATFKAVTVKGTVHGVQDGDTTWLYAKEVGEALNARIPVAEAYMQKFNEVARPLNVHVGDIAIQLERKSYSRSEFELRGYISGVRLPSNAHGISKNDQVLGKSVRSWFDSAERQQKIQSEIVRLTRDLEALNGAGGLDEWPHFGELEVLKARKSELDRHFAAKEQTAIPQYDPFIIRLAEYKADLQMKHSEDSLERYDPMMETMDLLSDEIPMLDSEGGAELHDAAQKHQVGGMR